MGSDEAEEFYNKRLETILKFHTKYIIDDKNLSEKAKRRQLDMITEMLEVARRSSREMEGRL